LGGEGTVVLADTGGEVISGDTIYEQWGEYMPSNLAAPRKV